MSERLTACPQCRSTAITTVKLHNPETHDMNCDADLRCEDCKHEWVGRVTSPYCQEQRRQGFWI